MKNQNIFGTKSNNKKMPKKELLRFMKKVDYKLYDTFSFATVFFNHICFILRVFPLMIF